MSNRIASYPSPIIRRRAVYLTDIDRPHKCGAATCGVLCGLRDKERELDAKENAVEAVLDDPNGDARAVALVSLAVFLVAVVIAVMSQ